MFSTKKISAKGKGASKPVKKAPVKTSGGAKTTGGWLGSGSGELGLDKWYGECLHAQHCASSQSTLNNYCISSSGAAFSRSIIACALFRTACLAKIRL